MTEGFKAFLDNQAKVLNILPEDLEYYYSIHEEKPLASSLKELFGDKDRLEFPIDIKVQDEWEEKFRELFYAFYEAKKKDLDFINWICKDGKQQVKITKAITAFYLDEYTVENWDLIKTQCDNKKLQFVLDNKPSNKAEPKLILSRVPEDFYMAATSQPQGSCIGLDNKYGRWEGIMNAVADPYRVIAYITSRGKVTFGTTDVPEGFKPFSLTADKFIGRSWAMVDDERKNIFYPRWFGNAPENPPKIKGFKAVTSTTHVTAPFRGIRCYKDSPVVIPTVYYDKMTVELDLAEAVLRNKYNREGGTVGRTGLKSTFIDRLFGRTQRDND